MLKVNNLQAYYGKSHILQGVDLTIGKGEIVALLGRNGAGRSTCCKAIMGELTSQNNNKEKGAVFLRNQDITALKPHQIAHLGIGYVPENRDIFQGLTTRQNLILGQKPPYTKGTKPWTIEDIFALFPHLEQRADVEASVLSGGEQQMLALSRTLMGNPELLMIDEPTEGLAPQIIHQLANTFLNIAERGISILLVEQKLTIALSISHRIYVMGQGKIVYEGTPTQLQDNTVIRTQWLGL